MTARSAAIHPGSRATSTWAAVIPPGLAVWTLGVGSGVHYGQQRARLRYGCRYGILAA
jgi:hypothetical protein